MVQWRCLQDSCDPKWLYTSRHHDILCKAIVGPLIYTETVQLPVGTSNCRIGYLWRILWGIVELVAVQKLSYVSIPSNMKKQQIVESTIFASETKGVNIYSSSTRTKGVVR